MGSGGIGTGLRPLPVPFFKTGEILYETLAAFLASVSFGS